MTITEVARSWIENRDATEELLETGHPMLAHIAGTEAAIAREEIERRLAELFAAGAR